MKAFIVWSLLTLHSTLSAQQTQGNNYHIVGAPGETGCDYHSLQDAIDNTSASIANIRVSTNGETAVYQENLISDNKAITFWGGYQSCADAENGQLYINSPRVYLTGNNNGPTIKLTNQASGDFYFFEVTGGNGNQGGGAEALNSKVRFLNSFIHSNQAIYGGGIYTEQDNVPSPQSGTTFELRNTIVAGNQSTFGGGGIYCVRGNGLIDDNSGVSANQVTDSQGDGGGLFLSFCDTDIYAGTNAALFPSDEYTYAGIRQNSAPRNGGGAFIVSSAVNFKGGHYNLGQSGSWGNNATPMLFDSNQADSDQNLNGSGGGIYATGQFFSPSIINVENSHMINNSAYEGGAFYLGSHSTLNVSNHATTVSGQDPCWSEECSVIEKNHAKNRGGAVFMENGNNSFSMTQSYVKENRSDYGSVISVDGTAAQSDIYLAQNMIYHNGRDGTGGFMDKSSFSFYNNSQVISQIPTNIRMVHNTIADNHNTQAVIVTNGVQIFLDVLSSILNDESTPLIADFFSISSAYNFDCVNTNNSTSLDSQYTTRTRMDSSFPGFVVRNYDYTLKRNSNTEDFCDDSLLNQNDTTSDVQNDTRAIDNAGFMDLYGPWDLGADELNVESDAIFIDAFDW